MSAWYYTCLTSWRCEAQTIKKRRCKKVATYMLQDGICGNVQRRLCALHRERER